MGIFVRTMKKSLAKCRNNLLTCITMWSERCYICCFFLLQVSLLSGVYWGLEEHKSLLLNHERITGRWCLSGITSLLCLLLQYVVTSFLLGKIWWMLVKREDDCSSSFWKASPFCGQTYTDLDWPTWTEICIQRLANSTVMPENSGGKGMCGVWWLCFPLLPCGFILLIRLGFFSSLLPSCTFTYTSMRERACVWVPREQVQSRQSEHCVVSATGQLSGRLIFVALFFP